MSDRFQMKNARIGSRLLIVNIILRKNIITVKFFRTETSNQSRRLRDGRTEFARFFKLTKFQPACSTENAVRIKTVDKIIEMEFNLVQ